MNTRLQDAYIYATAGMLFFTALVKFTSLPGTAPILDWLDPLLPLSNRMVFLLGGLLELGLSAYLFLGVDRPAKILAIGWLALIYLIYRLGLWWAGAPGLCHCLGNLTDRYPISPVMLNRITWILLGWLLLGSHAFVIAHRLIRRTRESSR